MERESITAIKALKLNPAKMMILLTLKFMHLCYRALPYMATRYGKFTLRLPLCLFDRKITCSLFFRPFLWSDIYAIYEQYVIGIYERLREVMPGDVVVDIGAYFGDFTLKACSRVGSKGKVIAFEPSPEEYDLLKRNVSANLIRNCLIYNIACGNNANQILYWSTPPPHNPSSRSLVNKSAASKDLRFAISIQRLDDVCKNVGIAHVDFLKIDVEGFGLEVLKGAEGLLKTGTFIAMEIHLPSECEVGNFLSKLGYRHTVHLNSPWGGRLYAFRTK